MRVAAVIFLTDGLTLLVRLVSLFVAGAVGLLGIGFWIVFAAAMLHQSYTLFRARPRARVSALISSAALAIGAAASSAIFVSAFWPIARMPAEGWSLLAAPMAVMVAFSVAFVFLSVDRNAV